MMKVEKMQLGVSEMSEMLQAIQQLEDAGHSRESIQQTIENALKQAYKRAFGKLAENCVVKFADDMSDVFVYSRKTIVDGVYDPVTEMELEDARKLSAECEVGDEIDIRIDPKKDFAISAVSAGKGALHQELNESYKNRLLNEFRSKKGEIIIGYYQRELRGNIYVDLGKVEGILPAKYQSPIEHYEKNDRIKALVVDIKPIPSGVQLVLSRSDPDFVKSVLSLEVPEIMDGIVEIRKVVRAAGYRTKVAVSSSREGVDPVGACVGMKGIRIQNVIREIDGEKMDIVRWWDIPERFIAEALAPAKDVKVYITDVETKRALAVVPDSQYSLAIGRQGQNVRLANRLCDWSIDVKTETQAKELDLSEVVRRPNALFNDIPEDDGEDVEYSLVSELPEVGEEAAAALRGSEFDDIEKFVEGYDSGALVGSGLLRPEQVEELFNILHNYVEFVDDDSAGEEVAADSSDDAVEEYECPECHAKVTPDMTKCPSCGVSLEFSDVQA